MSIPFTYHLHHIPTNTHYYGCRYGKQSTPDTLWTTYFTSSKYVKQLIASYGVDSFYVEIRKIFDSADDALLWEQNVLRRLKVLTNPKWINKNICGSTFAITAEGRESIKQSKLKYWEDPENTKRSKQAFRDAWTQSRRDRQSLRNHGMWKDPQHRALVSESSKRLWEDPEYRKRYEGRNGRKIIAHNLIFESIRLCAKHFNKSTCWVRNQLKRGEFSYL